MLGGNFQKQRHDLVSHCARATCTPIAWLALRQVELPPVEPRGVLSLLQVGHVRVPPHLLRLYERIQVDG